MRTLASILLGKAIFKLSRFLKKGGGSAAPGLYALKIYPELVKGLTLKIPTNIIITGTNGKTTTARMLTHFAKTQGLKVIRNHTGSNLERGIASTLVNGVNLSHPWGGLDRHLGIWEVDEATFSSVAPKINPKIIVFLNVFRDQLDRYGEIDSLVKKWGETLQKLSKNTIILINGDDVNTTKLKKYFKGKIYTFGLESNKITGEGIEKIKNNKKLNFEAKNIKLNGLTGSFFQLSISQWDPSSRLSVILPIPGIYHIYDFLAAFAIGHELGFKTKNMISSLKSFSPAFGRVEKFSLQPSRLHRKDNGYIFLIKNPAGATAVFETIAPQLKKEDRLFLALNDNLADGTDVSWIWDAGFEKLLSSVIPAKAGIYKNGSRIKLASLSRRSGYGMTIVASGTRAYDLANRLKYAGFNPKSIFIEPDIEKAFKEAKRGLKGRLFVLPTYTAMLELQTILTKSGIKKPYWEEDN